MKVETIELSGIALDWAVAMSEGKDADCEIHAKNIWYGRVTSGFVQYRPSTDWAVAGPIIDTLSSYLMQTDEEAEPNKRYYCTTPSTAEDWHNHPCQEWGPTFLIAAMRAYVASKLGDVIDIPDEIFNG